jgi:uncharacterized protein YdeI (YjbR/CyaY-like superfamily)
MSRAAAATIATLDLRSRREWRRWLATHHDTVAAVWLVFHKQHTGVACLGYDDAVEEALCYGWVDSIIKRLDDERYVRKFTPRRAGSVWSTVNRRRHADLARRGLLAEPGRKRAPTGARRPPADTLRAVGLPAYVRRGLRAEPRAWRAFQELAPSYRRRYVGWIHSARLEETRLRRLREVVRVLAAGRKLGMK